MSMVESLESYFDRLWPLNRSLTGDANRYTLKILSELVDMKIIEVQSGQKCFDWEVPAEWNVDNATIKNSKGETIIDIKDNNLHLISYSEPFNGKLTYEELKNNIFTLPEQPSLIPYLTSYYKRRWGFCMSHNQFLNLDCDDIYEVSIDSSFNEKGSMTIGEALIKGESTEEILFSTYICHPSLANNELSGPLVTAFIYSELSKRKKTKFSYRFIFIPETIGSIYYLSENGESLKNNLAGGLVVTCVGDSGNYTYKRSRRGNALIDRAVELILEQKKVGFQVLDFFPDDGSDERQFCSPGFNLPVGSLTRSMYGTYQEYHTSADNKDFISFEAMEETISTYLDVINLLENNEKLINLNPNCEPHLGSRGLYPSIGSPKEVKYAVSSMMWLLNYADGQHDLIDIAKLSKIPISELIRVKKILIEANLITIK